MRVKAQSSAEPTDDVAEHAGILFGRVRVVGRHDAAPAEVGDRDLRVRQSQSGAGPLPLASSVDTPDEDVRTQPSDITTEHRHGAVCANEQRQDVEPLRSVESRERGARRDRCLDLRGHLR